LYYSSTNALLKLLIDELQGHFNVNHVINEIYCTAKYASFNLVQNNKLISINLFV